MSIATRRTRAPENDEDIIEPVTELLTDPSIPLLHEDEGLEDMGDADIHTRTIAGVFGGLHVHLRKRPKYRVFANLNLIYSANDKTASISPDLMIVVPFRKLGRNLRSYVIGQDGPAPLWVGEVLSQRTFEEGDLGDKPLVYAGLRVPEYALIDALGEFISVRLLLKKLQRNGAWKDTRDADGGITSNLGFRLTLEADGEVRVRNAATGEMYLRPEEAADQIDAMAAELAKLRRQSKRKK